MANTVEKKRTTINVITADKKSAVYGGNAVIATGTKEELERYKQQLINAGYTQEFNIEVMEHTGWDTTIRFSGYNLVEYDGLLYPQINVQNAQVKVTNTINEFENIIVTLESLKAGLSNEDTKSCDIIIGILIKRIEETKTGKLNIAMLA